MNESSQDAGVQVTVNGEPRTVATGASVSMVLEQLGIVAERGVAVAVDGAVVPRSQWSSTTVARAASVEIIRAVQGG